MKFKIVDQSPPPPPPVLEITLTPIVAAVLATCLIRGVAWAALARMLAAGGHSSFNMEDLYRQLSKVSGEELRDKVKYEVGR